MKTTRHALSAAGTCRTPIGATGGGDRPLPALWSRRDPVEIGVRTPEAAPWLQAISGPTSARHPRWKLAAAGLAAFLALAVSGRANPTGGQLVAGSVTIATSGNTLTITQTSGRAIINWQDFSNAAGELTHFIQPDATSATLNRVISGQPSSLLGDLQANGQVFLINPNGILVGAGARIDTGGFLASTLDVANQEFLAGGDLRFSGGSAAAVKNLGAVNALGGDVFLIARQVENSGAITAAAAAGLAAGSEILLTTGGSERLFVLAGSSPGTTVNSGAITATTAELKAAGGNAYAFAINNTGLVRATGSAERGGQLWLVAEGGDIANDGMLDVSSATGQGGDIKVTGERVSLDLASHLNASGATGGGTMFVLGGAEVNVDGALDARATAGGDGGFVETSAAQVRITGSARVNTTSAQGHSGTWLIDPVDFTISAGSGALTTSGIGATTLSNNLGSTSVSIATDASTGGNGDILVNSAVSWSANKLTLTAHRNIAINAALNGSGTASLALAYGQGAAASDNTSDYTLNNGVQVTLPAGSNFSTKLGSDGTVKNYTVITSLGAAGSTTKTDLQGINGGLGTTDNYALGADIDATATSGWNSGAGFNPLGTSSNGFKGTFTGLGHTISNLTISRTSTDYVGLFGKTDGGSALRNVGLVGGNVSGREYVGALVGVADGTVGYSSASVSVSGINRVGGLIGQAASALSNSHATGSVTGSGDYIGGLVGYNYTAALSKSYASGSVSGGTRVGGLAGINYGGAISTSYATGSVTGSGNFVGGLIGHNSNSNASITTSYATGNVTGSISYVGGLVGSNENNIPISNSYATGSVSGSTYVGGLLGYYTGTITNSYATGNVSGTSFIGGLVGFSFFGTMSNGYWNTETSGRATSSGGTGLTTAQMKQQSNFSGFDFTNIWILYPGQTTPLLRNFMTPLTVTANNSTKTYDGLTSATGNGVTYSATPNSNLLGTATFTGGGVNAGTHTLTPGGLYSNQQGYAITFATGSLTVGKADLTLSGTRVYDGTTLFAGSNLTATGVHGETFTVTGAGASGNLGTKNVQTNQALATLTGLALGTSSNGGLAGNYNSLSTTGSTVSVTAASLTLSTSNVSKTYDGGLSAAGTAAVSSGTLFSGDTLSGGTFAFADKNAGSNKTVTTTGVTVNDGNSGGNYTVGYANNTTSTITPYAVSLTGTRTYDGTTNVAAGALTIGTLVGTETLALTGTGTVASKDVGTGKTVTLGTLALGNGTNGGLAGNYTFTGGTQTADITARAVDLTGTRTYDGTTNVAAGAFTLGTLVGTETLALTGTGTVAGKDVGTGKTVTLGTLALGNGTNGGLAGNYTFTGGTQTADITAATLTYTASAASRVYGLANPAFSGTVTGFVNSETQGTATTGTLGFSTTATTLSPAGSYALTGSGLTANNGNYVFVQAAGNATAFTIGSLAPLTITADDKTKLYGAALPTFTASYAGFVNGDTSSVITGLQFSTTATMGSNVGTYAITPFGATAPSNYSLSYVSGTLTINPAALTLTANNASRLYGAANAAFTASYSGLVNGDTSSVVTGLQFSTPAIATSNVGGYAITPSGASASNYTLSFAPGTLTIDPATLTYAANAASRPFGAANPAFSGTVTGFVNSETQSSATTGTLGFSTIATSSSAVGNHALTGSGLTANHGNYVFAQAPGNATAFTIGSQVPLTITADDKTKLYGAVLPAFTASYAGLVNGDTSSVVTGLQFSTTATMGSNVGTFSITPFGATAPSNYSLSYVPGTLTINPTALTLTANSTSRLYGAADPAFTASYSGLVNDDTAAVVTGLQFGTSATAASGVGGYAITLSGASASNYTFAYLSGTLTVHPAPLTLTATDAEREYGAANPAFDGVFSGFVNGDTAAVVSGLQFGTPATATSVIGDYAITPLVATAANYTLAFVNGTLRVLAPTVTVGTTPMTVARVGQQPALTSSYAVVMLDGRSMLVPVDSQGGVLTAVGGASASEDARLARTLTGSTSPADSTGGPTQTNQPNFGSFELVASLTGGPAGVAPDALSAAQLREPGLIRESSVRQGGFNMIYHEALAAESQQEESNTAAGSSYREFLETEKPEINLVRAKTDDSAAGGNSGASQ